MLNPMKKFECFLLLLPTLAILNGAGATNALPLTPAQGNNPQLQASGNTFNYDDYAAVLKTYVNPRGLVNYKGLQANRQRLDRFSNALAAVTPSTYSSWSEKEQIAFLLNAYNAFTLQSIVDQNPLKKSIREIAGVWKWRKFKIAGQSKTLDNIEHKTLRVDFNEPRIHFALVCAAMSCPPLHSEPYQGEKLDTQLDEQVRKFLNSPHGLHIDQKEDRVYLSSIFKWYGKDWKPSYSAEDKFTGNAKERAVLNFVSNYLSPQEREYLAQGDYKISYLDYDWSLNQQ